MFRVPQLSSEPSGASFVPPSAPRALGYGDELKASSYHRFRTDAFYDFGYSTSTEVLGYYDEENRLCAVQPVHRQLLPPPESSNSSFVPSPRSTLSPPAFMSSPLPGSSPRAPEMSSPPSRVSSLSLQGTSQSSQPLHGLLRLPPIFWSRMHLYVDYIDILNLSRLNKQFAEAKLELYLPWRFRHAVVSQHELESNRLRKSKNKFACYICYKLKPPGQFQRTAESRSYQNQYTHALVLERDPITGVRTFQPIDPETDTGLSPNASRNSSRQPSMSRKSSVFSIHPESWDFSPPGAEEGEVEALRRYCIPCALKCQLSIPGDFIYTHEMRKLWVCHCRKVHEADTNERCVTCQMLPVYRRE